MRAAGGDAQRRMAPARAHAPRIVDAIAALPQRADAIAPPCQSTPVTGACTTPNTATPSSISAMLTVNSPLRLTNSRVPSSGSTSHSRGHARRCVHGDARCDSSDSTGMSVSARARPSTMQRCAARSAAVSGEASSLLLDVEVAVVDARGSPRRRRARCAMTPSRVRVPGSVRRASCVLPQPFAGDEQGGDAAAFGEVLAQDQLVQVVELPRHHSSSSGSSPGRRSG